MNYFDCHADTLTVIEKKGETLWKNSCDLDLERTSSFAEKYTQIFSIWKDAMKMNGQNPQKEFDKLYEKAVSLLKQEEKHIPQYTLPPAAAYHRILTQVLPPAS